MNSRDKNNHINLVTYLLDGVIYTLIFWLFWQFSTFFGISLTVSAFYPAPALNMAMIYFFGWRYLPIVFIAACMATVHIQPLWEQETFIWFNNLRQVAVYGCAAYVLRHLIKNELFLSNSRNTLYFLAVSILFSTIAAATGVLIFYVFDIFPKHALFNIFASFLAGDISGILMLSPLAFLVINAWKEQSISQLIRTFWHELKTLKTLVIIASSLFSALFFAFIVTHPEMSAYGYLIFIPLIWVAATYGATLASLTALLSNLSGAAVYVLMEGAVYTSNELQLIFATAAAIAIFIGVSRDDRLRAEHRAVEQETTLANMSRIASLGELSNTIAHEIATPLQVVSSNLQMSIKQLTKNHTLDTKQLMEYQTEMKYALNKAIDIHQRIRQSSVSNNKQQIGQTYLHTVLDETQRLLKRSILSSGVTVIITGIDLIPPVHSDSTSMLQVFINLFKNAISSMLDTTSNMREIHCQFSSNRHFVQVKVSDTGPGFNHAEEQRVFDSFYTTKKNGLGLGLSICRTILEGIGGNICIEQGKSGANFVLTIPIYKL